MDSTNPRCSMHLSRSWEARNGNGLEICALLYLHECMPKLNAQCKYYLEICVIYGFVFIFTLTFLCLFLSYFILCPSKANCRYSDRVRNIIARISKKLLVSLPLSCNIWNVCNLSFGLLYHAKSRLYLSPVETTNDHPVRKTSLLWCVSFFYISLIFLVLILGQMSWSLLWQHFLWLKTTFVMNRNYFSICKAFSGFSSSKCVLSAITPCIFHTHKCLKHLNPLFLRKLSSMYS